MQGAKGVVKPNMNSGLSFFICISSSSQKLVIPPVAISQMPSENRVILRDRYGKIWPVKVDINGDEWSFKEGWPRFYNDNCLKPLDNLLFEYKGGSTCVFDFTILQENGCEKRGAQKHRINAEYGVEEIDEKEFEGDLNKADDDDDHGSDDLYYDDDDEQEDACENKGAKMFKVNDEYEVCEMVEHLNKEYDDDVQEEEESMSNKSDIFKSTAGGTTPINRPSFFIRARTSRRNELFIPKKLMVDYKLKIPKRLFLVDVRGNKWRTKVIQWQNGRVCCKGGWKDLYKVNNIKQGNACICEFMLEQDPPCILVRRVDDTGTSASKHQIYKKKRDYYGAAIFSKGMAMRPQNRPFFVSSSRPRRHELMIPNEVIKDYKLKLPDALSLVDERGERWETKVKQWGDGRVICSGGWSSLCNVNGIHKNDVCICEFFLEHDDPRIHVRLVDVGI